MFYTSIIWYLFCIVCGFGCFIYNFGEISRGRGKELIRFVGGILFLVFIILSFFVYGWNGGLALVVVQLVLIVPVVHLIITKLEKKLYKHHLKFEEDFAKKLGMTVDEMEKYKDIDIEKEAEKMGVKKYLTIDKTLDQMVKNSLPKDKEK